MKLTLKDVKPFVIRTLQAGICPMLWSSPGCGKSSLYKQIANEYNLELIDIRLTSIDPTDLNGFGTIQNGIAKYIPFDTFPLESTPLPKGKDGWLIVLNIRPSM